MFPGIYNKSYTTEIYIYICNMPLIVKSKITMIYGRLQQLNTNNTFPCYTFQHQAVPAYTY